MINATPFASGLIHEAEPMSAKPPATRRGFIQRFNLFFTALISDLMTKISVKSTSSAGLRKSSHMATFKSSRRLQISAYNASSRLIRCLAFSFRWSAECSLSASKAWFICSTEGDDGKIGWIIVRISSKLTCSAVKFL